MTSLVLVIIVIVIYLSVLILILLLLFSINWYCCCYYLTDDGDRLSLILLMMTHSLAIVCDIDQWYCDIDDPFSRPVTIRTLLLLLFDDVVVHLTRLDGSRPASEHCSLRHLLSIHSTFSIRCCSFVQFIPFWPRYIPDWFRRIVIDPNWPRPIDWLTIVDDTVDLVFLIIRCCWYWHCWYLMMVLLLTPTVFVCSNLSFIRWYIISIRRFDVVDCCYSRWFLIIHLTIRSFDGDLSVLSFIRCCCCPLLMLTLLFDLLLLFVEIDDWPMIVVVDDDVIVHLLLFLLLIVHWYCCYSDSDRIWLTSIVLDGIVDIRCWYLTFHIVLVFNRWLTLMMGDDYIPLLSLKLLIIGGWAVGDCCYCWPAPIPRWHSRYWRDWLDVTWYCWYWYSVISIWLLILLFIVIVVVIHWCGDRYSTIRLLTPMTLLLIVVVVDMIHWWPVPIVGIVDDVVQYCWWRCRSIIWWPGNWYSRYCSILLRNSFDIHADWLFGNRYLLLFIDRWPSVFRGWLINLFRASLWYDGDIIESIHWWYCWPVSTLLLLMTVLTDTIIDLDCR